MAGFASTVVGSALISAFFSVLLDRLASPLFLDYCQKDDIDDGLLRRLRHTMMTVHVMLNDAEEIQFAYPMVKRWIDELKDVIYNAEDLVDEIAYVGLAGGHTRRIKNSSENFKSRFEEMILKAENLVKDRDVFQMMKNNVAEKISLLPTMSFVDESKIYGREKDNLAVKELLMNHNTTNEIPIIAICGMNGVGKTALAQLIYNDSIVVNHFRRRVWVYASKNLDVLKVCQSICESVTLRDCNTTNLEVIQKRLKKALANQSLLLVLDEVWNEDLGYWDTLRNLLKVGTVKECRIIVTTSNQGVASNIHSISCYPLHPVSDEDCWSIFATHAFKGGIHIEPQNLEHIRDKIVKKCQGLPLAAKLFGSLLSSKMNAYEWETLLNRKLWELPVEKNDLLVSLGLSYYFLPHMLKRCFSYCSVLPKGYLFDKEKLILLWKAEGFLLSTSYKTMEEVGGEYFEELISRSFFQEVHNDKKICYVMHDLHNELAQYTAGESCFKYEIANVISQGARHFSFVKDNFDFKKDRNTLTTAVKCLRTFLPLSFSAPTSNSAHIISDEIIENLLGAQKQLRVLSLYGYNIFKLSCEFSKLIHLRSLDLSYNPITTLPDSTGVLYNLEILMLSHCTELIELPTSLGKLINLDYLDLNETKSLKWMPLEFSKLEKLQTLTTFVVSNNDKGSKISELGKLERIRGRLSILGLQNVSDGEDAENARLKDKKGLKELVFRWEENVVHDLDKDTVVLEKLHPPDNIEKLSIEGYHGTELPDWLGDSSFSSMVFLCVSGCKNCPFLPSIGKLSYLEELYVKDMEKVQKVGFEFYGKSVAPFEFLSILKFVNIPNWEFWETSGVTDGEFPILRELHLKKCEKLIGKLPDSLPLLVKLHIVECSKLEFLVNETAGYPNLEILEIISSCVSLMHFKLKSFNKLKYLFIKDCKNLENIEVSEDANWNLQYIEDLGILDCPKLNLISEAGLPAPSLKSLMISNCNNLESMPNQMYRLTSLEELRIFCCSKLQSFPNGGLPPNLQSLLIEKCDLLTPQHAWGLNNMVSLTKLRIIGGCKNLKLFPEEGLLPASLTSLQICEFPELETLNLNGLQLNSSLEKMEINTCASLRSMSAGSLPGTLSSLEITGCSLMTERCQVGGEDWSKIRHIQNKVINGEIVILALMLNQFGNSSWPAFPFQLVDLTQI